MSVPDMPVTENFLLRKPRYGDPADVADINYNTDIIDTAMSDNRKMTADAYSNAQGVTYDVGDIREYLGKTYECIAPTSGNFDPTKWVRKSLGQIIEEHGSGASSLSDLDDVNLTTPTEGQILRRDASGDWVNTDMPDTAVTKEATGNPIELTDAASAPLVKCVTEIQGSQDLHGYDKPWVGGAGKNKLPLTVDEIKAANTGGTWSGLDYVINNVTFSVIIDNGENVTGIKVNGTNSSTSYVQFIVNVSLQSGSYILNGCPNGGTDNTYFLQFRNTTPYVDVKDLGSGVAFTISESITGFARIVVMGSQSITNQMFYPMIRLATESDPTFAPYSNICPITAYTEGEIEVSDGDTSTTHTTTYPSAIYRGSGDVVNGVASCSYSMLVFDGTENWYKASEESTVTNDYFVLQLGTTRIYIDDDAICSHFAVNSSIGGNNSELGFRVYYSNGWAQQRIVIRPSGYNNITKEQFKAWLANQYANNTPLQIAAHLITPITSSVTPTNLPIKSLLGYNHIESSTGDMEIEYIAKTFQPILDLMKKMVVANPSADATETLEKLKVDDTVYSLPSGGGIPSLATVSNTIS